MSISFRSPPPLFSISGPWAWTHSKVARLPNICRIPFLLFYNLSGDVNRIIAAINRVTQFVQLLQSRAICINSNSARCDLDKVANDTQ